MESGLPQKNIRAASEGILDAIALGDSQTRAPPTSGGQIYALYARWRLEISPHPPFGIAQGRPW